ncbi:MAG TPA: hypothetical protein VF077_05370 [Nitrospiraceae bacterium]
MANGVAPVCHIVRGQIWPEPKIKALAPVRKPTDQGSANQAIDTLADNQDKLANASWTEAKRNTQRVRIHNPDDYNQWVEVERITRVVFENTVTGQSFEWQYKPA